MQKVIKNVDIIGHKFGSTLTKVANQVLKVAKQERQKKE